MKWSEEADLWGRLFLIMETVLVTISAKTGTLAAGSPAVRGLSRAGDITASIGNTPLLRLARIEDLYGLPQAVELYAKAEYANPGGSVKDRAALFMIRDGEMSGALTQEKIILDASSGNTGVAYAMIGASLGYRVEICLPNSASVERKRLLRLYGASIVTTPAAEGTDGAIVEARRRYSENPARYFYPDQYNNPANWQAHYYSTGPEIWEQTEGRITHFVSVVGTSGTLMGTARRLREYKEGITIVEVQPDSAFHGLEGMKHMESAIVPGIYEPGRANYKLEMGTEDAQAMTRALARYEGVLTGPSGGAGVLASVRVARTLSAGVVVTILPDGGSRYLHDSFWDAEDDE
jgi:S-sulfo-L-cysteine synthase (O-acetyl-L-serine-dependent)